MALKSECQSLLSEIRAFCFFFFSFVLTVCCVFFSPIKQREAVKVSGIPYCSVPEFRLEEWQK